MNKEFFKIETDRNLFLPVSAQDLIQRGWDYVDIVVVTGDAYVDHPSFGSAIISRYLEYFGFRVAILAQPRLDPQDFKKFGRPKLGFFVASGNLDSMVANYTVAKNKRKFDYYTAGGITGKRPDRAVVSYCAVIRNTFGSIPIVIGGLEASLRRFAHYDYWSDKVHPSVLVESKADLLVYGMGEKQSLEIAQRLKNGENIQNIRDIPGICYLVDVEDTPYQGAECPSFKNVSENKKEYAVACRIQHRESDWKRGKSVKQRHGSKMLVQNPPMPPLSTEEFDEVYTMPYTRTFHPDYISAGGVPALEEVIFSVTHNRGCFGDCNFCSISFHQGRYITCRSKESILKEVDLLTKLPNFKGYIHDIGGPTANFRLPSCKLQKNRGMCADKKCLTPEPCPHLQVDHSEYLDILSEAAKHPDVKKVFVRFGIRYDYVMLDKNDTFLKRLIANHVSGQLKVAPEHCSAGVLELMGKPSLDTYVAFSDRFYEINRSIGKKQYLVPYLISSHPGSTLNDAVELAEFLKKERIRPEQVQDFYPTPGTISTCMYYTGLNPLTLEEVHVARNPQEKRMQRALLQYYLPQNAGLVARALSITGRTDLIGNGNNCLVKPIDKSVINKRKRRKK
ncbi:MAG: YgiQ family radical SAM protein [Acutalibacteraceae bacterium]|jgi:uncharacterized radical SAM protein YgiQ